MKGNVTRKPRQAAWMGMAAMLLLAAILPAGAGAESLNETDIRQMYEQAANVISNPKLTMQVMNSRLDDGFIMNAATLRTLGKAEPQTMGDKLNKAQLMGETMQEYDLIKFVDYDQQVLDIKFSADRTWGYVSVTSTMHGTVAVTVSDGKAGTAHYTKAQACVDTLALKAGYLRMERSDCKIQTQLSPPE